MNDLEKFANYLFEKNEDVIVSIINDKNRKTRTPWRLTDPLNFDYNLIQRDSPYYITSLLQLGIFQAAIFKAEQLGVDFPYYVIKKRDLLPCTSVRQAIEQTIGLNGFLEDYLSPYFKNYTEVLEDLEEAYDFLTDCVYEDEEDY